MRQQVQRHTPTESALQFALRGWPRVAAYYLVGIVLSVVQFLLHSLAHETDSTLVRWVEFPVVIAWSIVTPSPPALMLIPWFIRLLAAMILSLAIQPLNDAILTVAHLQLVDASATNEC